MLNANYSEMMMRNMYECVCVYVRVFEKIMKTNMI